MTPAVRPEGPSGGGAGPPGPSAAGPPAAGPPPPGGRPDALARALDATARRFGYDVSHNVRYEAIRRHVIALGLQRVLVLGCGRGVLESVLPAEVATVSVDIWRERLDVARELNAGLPSRRFLELDLMRAADTLGRRAFDGVILSEVIEHLPDDVGALAAARECLEPGGVLIVTVPNIERLVNVFRRALGLPQHMSPQHLREYTRDSLHGVLGAAGFAVLSTEPVVFSLPRDPLLRRLHLVGPRHPLRGWLLRRWPRLGTYLLVLARPEPD
jgi:SAM-dependent methyltransferase